MKALLYKQLKLVAHPMTIVFILSGAMLLIPNYPYTVPFFYVTLGLFFMFLNSREQKDNYYSAILPICKKDTVKSAVIFVSIIEIASIAVAGGFAVLSGIISPDKNNLAGIDANPALLGLGFLLFAMFNGIFLPSFYKSGYKVGASFVKSNIGVFFIVALDVALPFFVPWIDGQNDKQYIVLALGAIIYAVVTLLSYKKAAALYEKVDL